MAVRQGSRAQGGDGAVDDLKIVDTHQHFWDLERNYYPWLCDEPPAPHRYGDPRPMRRTYLPPDYFADAAGYNVVKMVHVEAEWDPGDPLGETRWLQEIAAAHGVPHALVAQAWLDRDDTEQMLAAQAAFANVRGVRHKPATALSPDAVEPGAPGSMGDARWRAGYALLESFGLSFDLQTNYWHLYEAADLGRGLSRHADDPQQHGLFRWTGASKVWRDGAQA